MKKFLLLAVFLTAAQFAAARTVRLHIDPRRPLAGESFMLELETDAPGTPRFTLPTVSGVRFDRRISSQQSRTFFENGRQEQSFRYGVAGSAEKPGLYEIPPFSVEIGGEKLRTAPFRFTVIAPESLDNAEADADRPRAHLAIEPDRPLYVGETATVRLAVTVPSDMRIGLHDIRKSGFGDGVFLTLGPRGAQFISAGQRRVQRGDQRFNIFELNGKFQPQRPGEYAPVCELAMAVAKAGRNDFFGEFFSAAPSRELLVRAAAKRKLLVRALPPPPAGSVDTGLIGDWRVSLAPPKSPVRVGEVAEATLTLTGTESAESIHAPELRLPDVRAYPPETKRIPNGFSVKYLFVPLTPGARRQEIDFAVFDPEKGNYRLEKCELKFDVAPGAVSAPRVLPPTPSPSPRAAAPAAPPVVLLPSGSPVKLPLAANSRTGIIVLVVAGIVMFLLAAVRKYAKPTPEKLAKRERKRQFSALAAEIRKSGASAALRGQGTAAVAEALGLPPGATPEEIAARLRDPELAEFFRRFGDAAFHPGGSEERDPALDRRLASFLKKVLLVLCCLAAGWTFGGFAEAGAAFDAGKYREAREEFRRMLDPDAPDPALYYNIGMANAELGEYPMAALAFEQALLLSPCDARYRAAKEKAEKKLPGVAEGADHSFTGFLAGLRDHLRPDQYLLLAAACFFLAGVTTLIGGFPGRGAVYGVLAVLFCTALSAAWTQNRDRYADDRARIVAVRAELHRLPAATGAAAGEIPGGAEVRIVDRRGDWIQIRSSNGAGGWVKAAEVERVCPHGTW